LAKASIGMFELPEGLAPPGMLRVIEKMCAKDPARRYPSARAVLSALRDISDEVIHWTPSARPVRPRDHSSSQDYAAHTPRPSGSHDPYARPSRPSSSASQSYTFDEADRALSLGRIALSGLAALAFSGVVLFVADRLMQDDLPPEPVATDRYGALLKPSEARPSEPAESDPTPEPGPTTAPDLGTVAVGAGPCAGTPPFRGKGRLETVLAFARSTHDVYIPTEYEPGVRHPMLVLFHDVQQTGSILHRNQMDKLAEEMNMVVLMPSDLGFAVWWDDEDVARSLDAIDAVQTALCIDPERIFVYGHGAGGRIAERLTCDYPQIAATATMSFRAKPAEAPPCNPVNPPPHLHIATLENGYVPVNGGKGCGMTMAASLAEYQESLRRRWGCEEPRKVVSKHREGTCWTWDCEATLVSCEVRGGREWPGTSPRAWDQFDCDGEPANFPYRKVFREFFESAK